MSKSASLREAKQALYAASVASDASSPHSSALPSVAAASERARARRKSVMHALGRRRASVHLEEADLDPATTLNEAARRDDHKAAHKLALRGHAVDGTGTGMAPLHIAGENDAPRVVAVLCGKFGANANIPGVLGLTPLHLAAANGKLAAATALLHAGADPNTTDDDGGTPLHWAAASGHSRMCRLLLSEDVNPLVENFAGKTALDVAEDETTIEVLQRGMRDETPYRCAELGKIRSVRRMVSTNAVYKDATDGPRGFTMLHCACFGGKERVVDMLVGEFHAKVDVAERKEGFLALHIAALRGHDHVVARFADGKLVDVATQRRIARFAASEGRSALHCAAAKGHAKVCSLLIAMGAEVEQQDEQGRTAMHVACAEGFEEVVKVLLSESQPPAKLDARTDAGATPLHVAVEGGFQNVVELLLRNAAPIGAKDGHGSTPLHYSVLAGHLQLFHLLFHQIGLEGGGGTDDDVDDDRDPRSPYERPNHEGMTLLHLAAAGGHVGIGSLLISKGARAALNDKRDVQPLHLAAEGGHADCVELLLSNGANLTALTTRGYTALHLSAMNHHTSLIRMMLARFGPNARDRAAFINALTNDGHGALHLAARDGSLEIVRLLVECGTDVHRPSQMGETPLHFAVENGNTQVVRYLLRSTRTPEIMTSARDSLGRQAMHIAAEGGNLALLAILVDEGRADPAAPDEAGNTALHYACARGDLATLMYLLKRFGARVIRRNKLGESPLHVSARSGNVLIAERLLWFGASPYEECRNGLNALMHACHRGHDEVVRMLLTTVPSHEVEGGAGEADSMSTFKQVARRVMARIRRRTAPMYYVVLMMKAQHRYANMRSIVNKKTALHYATERAHFATVRLMLGSCADSDVADVYGQTPLHYAAQSGSAECIEHVLEESSPRIDALNAHWQTPVHLAARHGHVDVLALLLERGADVSLATKSGVTPMHAAAAAGNDACVAMLLSERTDAECDVDAATIHGQTPLHAAVQGGHERAATILVETGNCEPDPVDSSGSTPLHWAAEYGFVGCIHMIIENGADVHAKGMYRAATALHLAARNGHDSAVRALLGHGARVNVSEMWNDATPLHMAAEAGHRECVATLLNNGAHATVADKAGSTAADVATSGEVSLVLKTNHLLGKVFSRITRIDVRQVFSAWYESVLTERRILQAEMRDVWRVVYACFDPEVPIEGIHYRMWVAWHNRKKRQARRSMLTDNWVVEQLRNCQALANLSVRMLMKLRLAMQQAKVPRSERIIVEGDFGDKFYLLLDGLAEVQITQSEGGVARVPLKRGATFGEAALLRDAPRSATVVAVTDCKLLTLDRTSFQLAVAAGETGTSGGVDETLLRQVPLFTDLSQHELVIMADLFRRVDFHPGNYVFRQGEWGDAFYIIIAGHAQAIVTLPDGSNKVVKKYQQLEYFGEIALLQQSRRMAAIQAIDGPLVCASMKKEWFMKLPPNVRKIMEERITMYSEAGRRRQEQRDQLLASLRGNKVFKDVSERSMRALLDSFTPEHRNVVGEVVCQKGDIGDTFYYIESGKVEVLIEDNERPGVVVKRVALGVGMSFGEMALLYDIPRTATVVVAEKDTTLLVCSRSAFQLVVASQNDDSVHTYQDVSSKAIGGKKARKTGVLGSSAGKDEGEGRDDNDDGNDQYSRLGAGVRITYAIDEQVIADVPLFRHVPQYLLVPISANMRCYEFEDGDAVIKQGDGGDEFFIVLQGRAFAIVDDRDASYHTTDVTQSEDWVRTADGLEGRVVKQYKRMDTFGEQALLNENAKRGATVVAENDGNRRLVVATLDRASFQRLPDIVHQALRGQAKTYKDVQATIEVSAQLLEDVERELSLAFRMIDTDGSGSIDSSEIKVMARALGMELTLAHIDSIMSTLDESGDDEVDFDEFREAMTEKLADFTTPVHVEKSFKRLCQLGGDNISAAPGINKKALVTISEMMGDHLTDAQLAELMQSAWVERYGTSGATGEENDEVDETSVDDMLVDEVNFSGIIRVVQ